MYSSGVSKLKEKASLFIDPEIAVYGDYKRWRALGVGAVSFCLGVCVTTVPDLAEFYESNVISESRPIGTKVLRKVNGNTYTFPPLHNPLHMFLTYLITTNVALLMMLPTNLCTPVTYKVAVRALNLGLLFGVGWMMIPTDTVLTYVGAALCVISFFHWSDFVASCFVKPNDALNLNAFQFFHSVEYLLVLLSGMVEFYLEYLHWSNKFHMDLANIPAILIIFGEALRKLAIFNLWGSFDHEVCPLKGSGLAKRGLYALFRHPYYTGWYMWMIGVQLLLCNPLTAAMAVVVFWNYFDEKIFDEEFNLSVTHAQDYANYQVQVPLTGIPFVKGFKVDI